ncbi:MAG: hypothetical protein O2829_01735 [Bacteroidetes bacterium]|nr:hypothetical protein [Bacteroidota bacterium]MDA1267800.1 hypothetical protein [Bacteroidota bacterium]
MQILNSSLNHVNQKSSLKALIIGLMLVFGFESTSIGQSADRLKEEVFFHIPKTLYFNGEKIWFEAQVSLGEQATPSQVLYAELVDRNSNSITHVKVPLQAGKALNFIPISDQIASDQYLIRVYTRISPYLDLNQGIAQQLVTIINPKIPPKEVKSSNRQNSLSFKSHPKGSAVNFSSSSSTESRILASGISIANPFLLEEQKQWHSEEVYESLNLQPLLPELFGHLVQAKVTSLDTALTYFLSLHGTKSALFTDHVDERGMLIFDAGGLRHWDRLILQLENGEEMPGLEMVSPLIKTTFNSNFIFPDLSLAQEDLPYLQPLLKAAVVQQEYLEVSDQDSLEVVTGFVADYSFNLDDYTRFEDVETVLKEYVPSVSVRLKDKKKTFRLLDEADKNVFDSNPLILVDAMPVFDSDLLASFNPKFLQRLEVLNREFYLNDRTYPGVLSFSSYSNNFGLFQLAPAARFFDYPGIQPSIIFDRDQFVQPSTTSRIPDWRTVLYWQTSGKGVRTKLPNLSGTFVYWEQVKVGGQVKTNRTFFEVKD